MKLSLGFSPCPNDTYIFDALVNGKIDTKGLEFDVVLDDVQTLNDWAIDGRLDISKISYGVLPLVLNNYTLLRSGGALGKGVGPLLISGSKEANELTNNSHTPVAIPGKNTTAHFLLTNAFPQLTHKIFMPFNAIEQWALEDPRRLGVIIHENRFTYEQKGLYKVADLGELWEQQTHLPIPLGGIVAHKKLDAGVQLLVESLIRQSVAYAFSNKGIIPAYVKIHAQEMDEQVMQSHIDLYVNEFSADVGRDGKSAIDSLLAALSPGVKYPELFAG